MRAPDEGELKRIVALAVCVLAVASLSGCARREPLGPAEFYWLLNRACWEGDDAGADPTGVHDYEAFEPSWPINLAAGAGHLEVVRLLLAGGAKVDAPEDEGQTALMLAAREGHLDVVVSF